MAKKLSESRSVKAQALFACLQAANGGIALFAPVLTPTQFATVSMAIGVAHAAAGVYYRSITSEPIG